MQFSVNIPLNLQAHQLSQGQALQQIAKLKICVQAMLKRRNDQLQKMLDAASGRPDPTLKVSTTPRQRIDLRESQILDNPTAYNQPEDASLVGIKEDAEGELKAQQSSIRLMDRRLGIVS